MGFKFLDSFGPRPKLDGGTFNIWGELLSLITAHIRVCVYMYMYMYIYVKVEVFANIILRCI